MLFNVPEVDMCNETHSGAEANGGYDVSVRSLSTMNLITLSWLLAAGQASVLPGADSAKCLDAAVNRSGEIHGPVH